ncbi:MAG: 3-phosphoshikimate 1-carboxyvinyltransferase [Clostridia bacterium]|nr:3-phosphoshikimate 1-carboxyvinyltransferase [Clostridia bacterium]
MNVTITPSRLAGSVVPPSSKSEAHRLLIAAALSQWESQMRLRGRNDDLDATIRCLQALGAKIVCEGDRIRISPMVPQYGKRCDCGESGSTLRFLVPVAAALRGAVFTGSGRLLERPIKPLLSLLPQHGCQTLEQGTALEVTGGLSSGVYSLPGNVSSQFVTGLMFALPLLSGDSEIRLTTPLQSRGYVDMTLRVLREFSIVVEERENAFLIPGKQRYIAPEGELVPEGDWSGAAFWYAANALGGDIKIGGLTENTAQRDSVIADFAKQLPDYVDMRHIPDLLPVLSVMACKKTGDTCFIHAERLRMKESDRLEACRNMIESLGGSAETTEDSLTVHGKGILAGGEADGRGDHRIVMAAAVASCLCKEKVTILGAQAASKSYPAFWNDFEQLGGKIHVL